MPEKSYIFIHNFENTFIVKYVVDGVYTKTIIHWKCAYKSDYRSHAPYFLISSYLD